MKTQVLAFLVSLLAGTLYGSTIDTSWNGGVFGNNGASGNWSTAANWTPATVPNNGGGNTYNVTITNPYNYPNYPDTVLLDTSPTISSLTLGSPLDPNDLYLTDNPSGPQSLTINGPLNLTNRGNLSLNSTTVSADSLIFEEVRAAALIGSKATLNLRNGIADIPYATSLEIAGTINSGGINSLKGLSNIEGRLTLEDGRAITISPNGGTLTVSDTGTFYVHGAGTTVGIAGNVISPGFFYVGDNAGASVSVAQNFTGNFEALAGGNLSVGGTLTGGIFLQDATANATTVVSNGRGELYQNGILSATKVANAGYFNVFSGGTLVVGSGSLPSGTTGYYQFANGTLAEIISPASAANGRNCTGFSDCGLMTVDGSLHLGGTLDPVLENGFDPANGESFIFLTFTSGEMSGKFSSIADQYFNHDSQQWVVTYGDGFLKLTAEAYAAPEPGTLLLLGAGIAVLGVFARRRHA